MVDEHYWRDKRLEPRDVLSAWVLVVGLLAFWLAFTHLGGRLSCELPPAVDRADQRMSQACPAERQPLSTLADQQSR